MPPGDHEQSHEQNLPQSNHSRKDSRLRSRHLRVMQVVQVTPTVSRRSGGPQLCSPLPAPAQQSAQPARPSAQQAQIAKKAAAAKSSSTESLRIGSADMQLRFVRARISLVASMCKTRSKSSYHKITDQRKRTVR